MKEKDEEVDNQASKESIPARGWNSWYGPGDTSHQDEIDKKRRITKIV